MKKTIALLTISIAAITQLKAQDLETVTGVGNKTSKSVFINGNTTYNVGNFTGESLYFLSGISYLESGNPSTGILAPLTLKSSAVNIPGKLLLNTPTDDGVSVLQINGRTKLGSTTTSGDLSLDGKQGATLATRLTEFSSCAIAPVNAGDLHFSNYWGVAIDINKGLAGDHVLANAAVIPSTSSFTINSFQGTNSLNTLFTVRYTGNVGIGITNPQSKLAVAGTITAKAIKVTSAGWPDFVFSNDYKLPSLKETAAYIKANKHLPNMPSAAEVEKNGQDLGEMNKILVQKVEELTLHLIELEEKLNKLEKK